jgi:nucleotide-binding universal stress UspA family protein
MSDKLLIATDGSKYSRNAVEYAIGLARSLKAPVIALYVVNMKTLEMYALSHHDDIGGYESASIALQADGDKALGYVAEAGKNAGVEVITKMVRGYPPQEIIDIAGKEGVTMIVVGHLGKTGLEHLLLGSVSEAVVKKAPCPVLVVRGNV